jgi:hypothetical protein
MEAQKTWNSPSNLSQRSNSGGIKIPDFQLCYRAIIIKTLWSWHKSRHADKWNRIEDPDTKPCNYLFLVFNKGAQNMCWRKDGLFDKTECPQAEY